MTNLIHEITAILVRLRDQDTDVLDLLDACQRSEFDPLWKHDTQLYCGFGEVLIKRGHPNRAITLMREGLRVHRDDADLVYWLSLAYARGGNLSQAESCLAPIRDDPDLPVRLKVEAWSLQGRLHKDRFERTGSRDSALRALEWYRKAYELGGDYFPAINATAMAFHADQREQTQRLASKVVEKCTLLLGEPESKNDYWLEATLGEAHFLQGNLNEAHKHYHRAVELAGNNLGDIASMRRNVQLHRTKRKDGEEIWKLFNIGNIVVFSGHMLDHPARNEPPRFPQHRGLEELVKQRIQQTIQDLDARVGYCSAACGADILFCEAMLEREAAELHIVLPFHKDDFYYTSVDFGYPELASWRNRFDRVLSRARHIHYATSEHFLGDEVLFGFVNRFAQGLAVTHAANHGVEPHAVVLLDRDASGYPGGTQDFLGPWPKHYPEPQAIDLVELRQEFGLVVGTSAGTHRPMPATAKTSPHKREIKLMLFADVKDSSKLPEEQSPNFHYLFLEEVAKLIEQWRAKLEFYNTWGDGLFVVFSEARHAAAFALSLLEQTDRVEWSKHGVEEKHPLRVGLHAGPVYRHRDPILNRDNFFGSHVVRAARIEPKTVPGCVYASEQFIAELAVSGDARFGYEFVGIEELAKGYDRCPLYRLDTKG